MLLGLGAGEAPLSYHPNQEAPARSGLAPRTIARIVVAAVLFVLLVIFVAQNGQRVRVDLFFWHGRPPLWLALVITAVIGAIIGQIAGYSARRARQA
jgi:uncharacterized integral membrane protein